MRNNKLSRDNYKNGANQMYITSEKKDSFPI